MIIWPVGQLGRLIQPHSPIPTSEVEHITGNHVGAFHGV